MFHQRPVAPPLDGWVESIWLCRSDRRPRALERVLPSGRAQLIVNLGEDETRVYEDAKPDWSAAIAGLHPDRSHHALSDHRHR